ncbi:carbohydrate kinase family protein [Salisaeta longa]|uniref:carbohydrate kinase family protein n=1 Tax=Salisaeta longa TaxID=503170 RepID=UPI0003B43548|nr:carbohydrate kinase [Salisaeta longa]
MSTSVLCVGELLWDALPRGLFLGGAPFNVACHVHQLGTSARIASRVGDDVLGHEALRRVRARGMSDDCVQVDAAHPTGFVEVALDGGGTPAYTIRAPAAWDVIASSEALTAAARDASALVFGSLAQRHDTSRATIRGLWATGAPLVFDVNLRPPHVERAHIEASLHAAAIAKMNDEELAQMQAWFGLPSGDRAAMQALADRFHLSMVCVTRGAHGAMLWHEGRWTTHPGYRVSVADTVGAGDAFLAGLLVAYLHDRSDADLLDHAARLGAYVASQQGATPPYDGFASLPALTRNPAPDESAV